MMEAQFPLFFMVALAVGAGLLAVLVLWLSKHIANEKTRSQGVAIAAITVGVLLLGLLVTRTSHRPMIGIHDTPVAPVPTMASGEAAQHSPAVAPPSDSSGQIHAHAHHHQPPVDGRVAAKFAWGPLIVAAVTVAVIVLLATSRKGLATALAGLGIAGVILSLIVYAGVEKQMVREVVPTKVASAPRVNVTREIVESKPTPQVQPAKSIGVVAESSAGITAEAGVTSSEKQDHSIDDDKAQADDKAKSKAAAEAAPKTTTEVPATPRPSWIDDEPSMEDGVYRAAIVSGPYSTRRECEAHLDDALRNAMMEYADEHLRPNARYAAWVDIGYVRNNMIEDRFFAEERYENPLGKMYKLHARLKIEPRDVARFEELARHGEERRAVETASAGGVFVFGALVVVYGALRFIGRKKRAAAADPAATTPTETTA
jgi:FtsH-binding integral membrane protein